MHSGMVRSFSTSLFDRIKVMVSVVVSKEDVGVARIPERSGRANGRTQAAMSQITKLNVAFDDYPQTRALKGGEVKSDRVALSFSDIKPANKFFKPMVRELKFDVSEMAIATYLQAKAYGKPLVLIPATIMGRFQHGTILCNAARPITPAELAGKRIGVRSYSQTTAVWVRGILENDYGV